MPTTRREFLNTAVSSALAAAALPAALDAQARASQAPAAGAAAPSTRRLRVQFTTGGHTAPIPIYAMFDSPEFADFDSVVRPHPHAFDVVTSPDAPDVIVTNDWITNGWPKSDQDLMVKHLEAGRGVVALHHAVGTNGDQWKWWAEQVTGCYLYNPNVTGMHTPSRLKQFVVQTVTPVGTHPIVKGLTPFEFQWDETFPNMWISPKATVLFRSDDPSFNNPALGWIGPPLPKGRVVCFQPGHTAIVCNDPMYHKIVHRMILWAGGRLA
jgi:type 1 glutamine amidotransferase